MSTWASSRCPILGRCARRRITCAPTRAAWACWSCPNIWRGRTGNNGSRSGNGWIANAASPRLKPQGLKASRAARGGALTGIRVRIRVSGSDLSFSAAPGQTLLDAALGASLNLPHSCKGGNCGACRARLLQGEIDYPNGPPLGLSDAEVADGYVLLCQARARTDLCIEALQISTPDQILTKRLPARIERAVPLSHDVMGLYLRLPAAEAFEFRAGQYIDVMLSGGRRRSFSIASPPHDSRPLELHVRRVEGGEFSAPLFDDEKRGALLTIEGPLGQFTYRDGGS